MFLVCLPPSVFLSQRSVSLFFFSNEIPEEGGCGRGVASPQKGVGFSV